MASLKPIALVVSISAVLTACGGDSDSSGGSNITSWVPADAFASYTGGRQLATITQSNSKELVDLLFGGDSQAPDITLSARTGNPNNIVLVNQDFLKEQELMLEAIKAKVFAPDAQQRTIAKNQLCAGGGSLNINGTLDETVDKAKLRLTYTNCKMGANTLNGNAYFLVYAYNWVYNIPVSVTLSYNGVRSNNGISDFILTGTVSEVVDTNTSTTRTTTQLHRRQVSSSAQSLIDIIRYNYGIGNSTLNGHLYLGPSGKVQVTTRQSLVYTDTAFPITGELLLLGLLQSKMRLTALGERMLQMDIDSNGDGIFEANQVVSE